MISWIKSFFIPKIEDATEMFDEAIARLEAVIGYHKAKVATHQSALHYHANEAEASNATITKADATKNKIKEIIS